MSNAVPPPLPSFARGHEFAPSTFALDAQRVGAYLAAIGDENEYAGCVPPLAAIAVGLEALQAQITLPGGALHTAQEVEHIRPLPMSATLTLSARIAQRSERQGYVISVIEFEVAGAKGPGLRARTTIMAPVSGA